MARAFNVMKDGDKERSLDIHDYLVKHPDATFFLKMEVVGPEGSRIEEGDVLVVDRSVSPRRGRYVVVAEAGELRVRKYLSEKEFDIETTLWGVIVGLLRKFD